MVMVVVHSEQALLLLFALEGHAPDAFGVIHKPKLLVQTNNLRRQQNARLVMVDTVPLSQYCATRLHDMGLPPGAACSTARYKKLSRATSIRPT